VPTLITADIHWSDNTQNAYRHELVPRLLEIAEKHHCTKVYILGDLTDEKDRHSAWLVNKVVRHLTNLTKADLDVTCLRGNHDGFDPTIPFFKFVGAIPRVKWINTVSEYDGHLFLPHTRSWKRDWSKVSKTKYKFIFAHDTFQGAQVGGRDLPGIPLNVFPPQATVISGDIHYPQMTGPITYVGAPYRTNFGDTYRPRVLILDEDRLTSVPMPGPTKRLIESDNLDDLKWRLEKYGDGDMVKVRIKISASEYDDWPQLRETIKGWCVKQGYAYEIIIPIVEAGTVVPASKRKYKSDEQLILLYSKRAGISVGTVNAGLDIMENN
jgi:Calcineurin-like phosphoesterase